MLLLVSVVGGIIEHLFDGSSQSEDGSGGAGLFGLLYSVFLGWPIGMSVSWVFLKAVRREEVRFLDIFAVFKRNYWNAVEALRESWTMTRGHSLTIFCVGLLAIPIFIAGFLALIVGVFVSAMWVSAVFAVLYHSVCGEGFGRDGATAGAGGWWVID